jgi:hypothetical protein
MESTNFMEVCAKGIHIFVDFLQIADFSVFRTRQSYSCPGSINMDEQVRVILDYGKQQN